MQRKLHGGFHWTELYLGALLALLGVLGAALLYWEWQQHKKKKDLARTAENLRFNADAAFLKRLIGQVRTRGREFPGPAGHRMHRAAMQSETGGLRRKEPSCMPG